MKQRWSLLSILLGLLLAPCGKVWGAQQEMDKVQERGEKLLQEAKSVYEEAHAEGSRQKFIEAGFKLEDARLKFLVLQEAGSAAQQTLAGERMKTINQLAKLIHDGKVAVEAQPAPPRTPAPPSSAPSKPIGPTAIPLAPSKPPTDPDPAHKLPIQKLPLPDTPSIQRADRQIKEVFREEYASKAAADRANLARTFATLAETTQDDPAARFVLLRESVELASGAGEVESALSTLDLLSRSFEYDPAALRTGLYAAAVKSAVRPEDFLKYAQMFLKLSDDALADERYDAAEKAAAEGLQMAKKAKNLSLVSKLDAKGKEVADRKAAGDSFRKARETLAQSPADPAANRLLGEQECWGRGNWPVGLAMLAKSGDPVLQDLAARDLAVPTAAADQILLGDGWWDLAEKKEGAARTAIRRRADFWYAKGEGEASGLVRLRIQQRRKFFREMDTASQIDLLRLIDLKRDVVSGQWAFEGSALLCQQELAAARVQIPYLAPEEYDVILIAERQTGIEAINVGLTSKGSRFHMVIDGYATQSYSSGLAMIDGAYANQNETARKGPLLANRKPSTIVCSVRNSGLSMTVDGILIFSWSGDVARLTNYKALNTPNPRALYLSGWDSKYRFSQMTLIPITGKGEILRD